VTDSARVVLVETSEALPGLLPFPAWDAMSLAGRIVARDPDTHPSRPFLYQAGVDVDRLEPATLDPRAMDLTQPGSPADRRLARALADLAEATAPEAVVYLLGPDDTAFGRIAALEAARRHLETEFVFLVPTPRGAELLRLVEVEARLRDPDDGCPWDLEQDHVSLARYLTEETYELLDAIESGDDDHLREELGDVLLQVVFHAQIAADRGAFTIDEVAAGIADKLVRRHPHVFGDAEVADADEVKANWDVIKQQEKQREHPFDGVPGALPALHLMQALQRKAAKLGFDWPDVEALRPKLHEELDELLAADDAAAHEEELGDLLAVLVGVARKLDIDAETALRGAATKLRRRFDGMLALARDRGIEVADLDADGWRGLWEESKAAHG
jgi:MazG family protein